MYKFVSFITPVYGVNEYLDDFFGSFVSLPKDKYEIVFVDDCYAESPRPWVAKWQDKVNVKYIKNEKNLGIGFTRNVALDNISDKATHFMMVDSDDILANGAWEQIVNAHSGLTISSKFEMFSKTKSKELKIWKNNFYKGTGMSATWGHLIPVKYKNVKFTSDAFEDQRWMAQVNPEEWNEFNDIVIRYRNRKSSVLNTNNNSEEKAKHILEFINELNRSEKDELIKSKRSLKVARVFSGVEYFYISRKNKEKYPFNYDNFTFVMKMTVNILGCLEKLSGFWWLFNKFTKKDYYK